MNWCRICKNPIPSCKCEPTEDGFIDLTDKPELPVGMTIENARVIEVEEVNGSNGAQMCITIAFPVSERVDPIKMAETLMPLREFTLESRNIYAHDNRVFMGSTWQLRWKDADGSNKD